MKKLMGLSFATLTWLTGNPALALKLSYFAEASLPANLNFNGTRVGGLSGMVYSEGSLFVVTDDRGKFAAPRFYQFEFKISKKEVFIKPRKLLSLKEIPGSSRKLPSLDLEGMTRMSNGNFLFSSEGNNNSKPRQMPQIFEVTAAGKGASTVPIANLFLPETIGQQKKGIQNNGGFEGLSIDSASNTLWAAAELPLVQDRSASGSSQWVRFIKYTQDLKKMNWNESAQFAYRIEDLVADQNGTEIFRGVSEILALSQNSLLVLERGVKIFGKGVYDLAVDLYLVDFSAAPKVQNLPMLAGAKLTASRKNHVLNFAQDLKKSRGEKKVQNFEALAWGPPLPDGRKTLLVLSDNNFLKNDVTELLVFTVEEESK